MKKITLSLFSLLFLGGSFAQEDVSSYSEKLLNWQTKDISGRIMGTNTLKTYNELIAGKPAKKKIIVAVIDAGVDIYHEDLRNNIWTNTKEIKGNGIDDDNNGYIDDVNGWNFLGNSKGENIDQATLEKTRMYRSLKAKYEGEDEVNTETPEYSLFKKLKKEFAEKSIEINKEYYEAKSASENINSAYRALSQLSGQKISTHEELTNFKPTTSDEKKIRRQLMFYGKLGATKEAMEEYYHYAKDQKEAHYNLEFTPRADIIGDDLNDITDNKYGNPDVIGPDAFHGTFCAGIIGASINNNKGINGIANNILIMPIRAVPNGDEYDKDVALAIRYAVDNGAQVINMSFGKGYSANKKMVDEAFAYAESKGVLLVHAAGNDNKNIDYEDNFPTDSLSSGRIINNLICVGASTISTKKKLPAGFSNYGNRNVDIFAPGQDIVSTKTESNYDISQGTSFAAPVVSGVAALVWSYYPELTAVQIKEIILNSATDLGKKKVVIPGTRKSKTRFRELSVSDGVVNTYNAFLLAEKMLNTK